MDKEMITEKITSSDMYKKRTDRSNRIKAVCTFLLFPVTLTSFAAGGFYAACDALTSVPYSAAPADTPGKSRTARKSAADPESPCLLYEAETAEETSPSETEAPPDNAEILRHLYDYDASKIPDGKYGIVPISMYKPDTENGMQIKNSSGLKIDVCDYDKKEIPVLYEDTGGYSVLIIHTHGTEAYTPEGVFCTDKGYYPRSDKKEENVVGIGDVFEEIFSEAGIKTLHCEIPIDKSSYSKAYLNAAEIIKEYIAEYPEIKYILDIHRDSIELSGGEKVKAVTAVNGKAAAQIMFVVGTDALVPENKNWGDNFAFAIMLQRALNEKYGGFARPINLKQGAYNQFYAPLCLLIEVGCDGNTYDEAKYAAKLTAEQIVHTLKGE